MSERYTTDWNHRVIDGVSFAMDATDHKLGSNDAEWLTDQILNGNGVNKTRVAVDIAVSFIRFSQDIKAGRDALQSRVAELEAEIEAMKRGEFICSRCHLRSDGEKQDAGF